jgi:hypothetical protein
VFPTGHFFGRITQKGPSKNVQGRTNLRQNFGKIFPEMAEKSFKMFCYLYFCHMKHKKHGIFTYFGTNMVTQIYSYFDEIKDAIFTKGLNFLTTGRIFEPSGRKILVRVGNTCHSFIRLAA